MINFIKTQPSDRRRERFKDVAAVLLILFFFLIFFWRGIFGGEFFLIHDSLLYSYPLRKVAWEMIRQGQLPLWTPLIFSGYPLLSMAQLALGYPLTWLYLLLPGHWAEQIFVLAPYVLAPAFTYAYARELGRSRTASLLAGLSFGYGGMMLSWISNGMMTNAVMWLPLALIAVLRAQSRRFLTCLLGMTGAYALSVLTGTGQGFVYVGILALAYATLLGLNWRATESGEGDKLRRWLNWRRWKPLAVVVCGIGLSVGIAAFQVFESWQAVRHSIREKLSFETFSQLSFTRAEAWRSFLIPLYHYVDTMAFVPPLAAILALVAVIAATRRSQRDVTLFFWLIVAVVAALLIVGPGTPLHGIAYRIPIVNSFRAPSRHTFEFTFAVSILAAYGWDTVCSGAPFKSRWEVVARVINSRGGFIVLASLVGVCGSIGAGWLLSVPKPSSSGNFDLKRAENTYLLWKAAFTLSALTGLGLYLYVASLRLRTGLLLALVTVVAFVEPYILYSRWGGHIGVPASRMAYISPASRFLQAYPAEQNRIYTRVSLFTAQFPALEGQNLSALAGLQNVAGYEPLILKRYSRALGNVWLDGVTPLPGAEPNLSLLDSKSRVLDLLNVRYLVTFPNLGTEYPLSIEKEGIIFDNPGLGYAASSDERITVSAVEAQGDVLALVTSLSNSARTQDGTPVARATIHTSDGRTIERELLAGLDSSELTQANDPSRLSAQRSMVPIFDQRAGDAANTFTVSRYWSRIPLGERVKIDRVEITRLIREVPLTLWMGTIYDSTTNHSTPLVTADRLQFVKPSLKAMDRWRPVYNQDNAAIFYNDKSAPRAWLAPKAERVDEDEALRRIRGESAQPFDPRQTALLEIEPGTAPSLPVSEGSTDARAQVVTYEPRRLVIETQAEQSSVLVVSEINYPGWNAQVDGVKAPIYQTDYLLRGVILPAGAHRVEMNYAPWTARVGGGISLGSLALIITLAGYARRTHYQKEKISRD